MGTRSVLAYKHEDGTYVHFDGYPSLDVDCLWVVVCGFGAEIYQDVTFLAVFWLVMMVLRIFVLTYNLFFYFRAE